MDNNPSCPPRDASSPQTCRARSHRGGDAVTTPCGAAGEHKMSGVGLDPTGPAPVGHASGKSDVAGRPDAIANRAHDTWCFGEFATTKSPRLEKKIFTFTSRACERRLPARAPRR